MLETIGWTPLIRLSRLGAGIRTPIYGKAEYANPGASVKDRIGLAIIEDAERRGELKPGGTIVEGTSGNTGVGLAIAASLKGYRCIFTMPDKMSQEKVRLLKAYGAEVVITPTAVPPDHPDNYVMKAKQIVKETPGAVLANQFYNPINPEAHYATTGPEIWEQTEGKVTHLVAGAGTGGTVSGVGKYLKEKNPKVRVIAADPIGSLYSHYHRSRTLGEGHPYKVEGIGGDKIPSTLWFDYVDEFRQVPDRTSFSLARRLAREEGILAGGSTGTNLYIALEVAREVDNPAALVVTIISDTGERYLSKVFNDEWMQENQMLEAPRMTVEQLLERRPPSAPPLVSVAPAAAVRQALNLMSTWGVSQIPVIDNGESLGGLIEGTLMTRALAQPSLLDRPVREVMEAPFPEVDASSPTDRVGAMLSRESPAALVRKDGRVIGIVSRYDVLQQLIGTGDMRITVLTGGTSSERDVALASAVQVIAALRTRGHEVAVVDTVRGFIPPADESRLLSASVGTAPPSIDALRDLERGLLLSGLGNLAVVRTADVLFLALHGGRGEDGTIQTLLEVVGVPYTGSGRLGQRHGDGQGRVEASLPGRGGTDRRLGDGPRRRWSDRTRAWVAGGRQTLQAGLDRRADRGQGPLGLRPGRGPGRPVRRRGHDRGIRVRQGAHRRGPRGSAPGGRGNHSPA